MSSWQTVPDPKLAGYLAAFAVQGSGLRGPDVHRVEAALTGADPATATGAQQVVVEVTDARRGRWRLTLTGATLVDATGWDEHDPAWESALRVLAGTWEVHDSAGCHYGVGRPVFGRDDPDRAGQARRAAAHLAADRSGTLHAHGRRARARIAFTGLRVEQAALARVPGSCLVCGSTRFLLQAAITVPVVLTGGTRPAYRAAADTAAGMVAAARLRSVFTQLACADCGTPPTGPVRRPRAGPGRGRLPVRAR